MVLLIQILNFYSRIVSNYSGGIIMEIRHLKYFESIIRNQQISKAAEELHISQPSLSAQIKALEEELGCKLIERNFREILLTEPGKILYKHALIILNQFKEVNQEIQDIKDLKSGKVYIGVLPTILVSWFPKILSKFHSRYPNVDVIVHEMGSNFIKEALLSYDINIGITSIPDSSNLSDLIEFSPITDEELFVITPINHVLKGVSEISIQELANEPFVFYEPDCHLHTVILEMCRIAGYVPHVVQEVGRVETVCNFVEAGLGISVIPKNYKTFGVIRNINIIKLKDPAPKRRIYISTHKNRYYSPAMIEFQSIILSAFTPNDSTVSPDERIEI
jgi:DNA-binding transcriptional LysR family regulator